MAFFWPTGCRFRCSLPEPCGLRGPYDGIPFDLWAYDHRGFAYGKLFVSILGGIVLHSLIPSLVLTVYVLMSLFFMTINYRGTDVLQRIAVNGSPFSYYISLVGDGMGLSLIPAIPAVERGMALISAVPAAGMGSLAGRMAAGLLAAVLMAVLGLFLYRFRPSEAAGRAMAFSVTKAPIKIFIVVPVTILMGVFFWSIYSSLAWAASVSFWAC